MQYKYDQVYYPHFLPSDHVQKYTIRLSLRGISPTIWRKFECPSNISLRHLTDLCLGLMEWWKQHFNQIKDSDNNYYMPCYQRDMDMELGEVYNQEDFRLSDLLQVKGKHILWEYDFCDSWMHEIRLSSIDEYQDGEPHAIVFKSGKNARPPEDCGGICGYQELLELREKRKAHKRLKKEEKEYLEWYMGEDFDPKEFDVKYCIVTCASFSDEKNPD